MFQVRAMFKEVRKRQSSFAVGGAVTVVLNASAVLALGIASILVARYLGPQQAGMFVWFDASSKIVAILADVCGVSYSTVYLLASARRETEVSVIRSTTLIYGLIMGAVVTLPMLIVPQLTRLVLPNFGREWLVPMLLNTVALSTIAQLRGLCLGESRFIRLGSITLLMAALFSGPLCCLLALKVVKHGVGVAWLGVGTNCLCAILFSALLISEGLGRPRARYILECMPIGWRAYAITASSYVNQRVDLYMVQTMIGASGLGIYSVVVSMMTLLTQVPAMLGQVLLPLAAKGRDPRSDTIRCLKRAAIVGAMIVVVALPVAFGGKFFVGMLFGPRFVAAIPLLKLAIPAIGFLSVLLMVNQHLAGTGYPFSQLLSILVSIAVNIGANAWLLRTLGLAGAPIAVACAHGTRLVMNTAYMLRKSRQA